MVGISRSSLLIGDEILQKLKFCKRDATNSPLLAWRCSRSRSAATRTKHRPKTNKLSSAPSYRSLRHRKTSQFSRSKTDKNRHKKIYLCVLDVQEFEMRLYECRHISPFIIFVFGPQRDTPLPRHNDMKTVIFVITQSSRYSRISMPIMVRWPCRDA